MFLPRSNLISPEEEYRRSDNFYDEFSVKGALSAKTIQTPVPFDKNLT